MKNESEVISGSVDLAVLDGSSMTAFVAHPLGGNPSSGIILFMEAFGVNGWLRGMARRLASYGHQVIAPDLYHRILPGFEGRYDDYESTKELLDALKDEELENDMRAAYGWLQTEGGIKPNAVSALGFCLGGRLAFVADSVIPLRSAACFYGGGITEYKDRVPGLYGPVLFVWGGMDRHITADERASVMDAMRENDKKYVELLFSDAGHGFLCDERPSYHQRSAELAWPFVIDFLDNNKIQKQKTEL